MGGAPRIVADIMEAAQQSADEAAFRRTVLAGLARAVPVDSAILVCSSADPRPAHINKGPFLPLLKRLSATPERYGPGLAKGQAVAARELAYLDNEIYTARERRELPFYREIMRPQGITSQVIGSVRFRRRQNAILYLCRHGRSRQFGAREREAVRGILPYVALGQAALLAAEAAPVSGEPSDERFDSLSPRERQIVQHVCAGLRNQDIATLLGTSPNTVRNQLQRIFERFHFESRTELAV